MTPEHMADHAECQAFGRILRRIGDKWTVMAVAALGGGPRRFNDIRRTIGGISQRMLTLTLRGLERDGLVKRTVAPTSPPRVDYGLTDLGQTLLDPLLALATWGRAHRRRIEGAQRRFDERRSIANRK